MTTKKVIGPGIILLLVGMTLWTCDPWVAYSPFEANLDQTYHGTTNKNLELINALDTDESKTFKVALLSDPHFHFQKLRDAIAEINKKSDYAFAIVTGDLTENGLKQEFVFFHQAMKDLKIPYLTTIGNHDYLANGEQIYAQMYGAFNYSFVFNNVKFVLFDNNTLESNKQPDMAWLTAALERDDSYDHVIPFSHIPPYDVQMHEHQEEFHRLLLQNDISLSIHGHRHDFSVEEMYGDSIRYATVSSPQKRTYAELTISPGGIEVNRIEF